MLELCSGLQPFRSRLAFDTGAIAGFRSGTATLGCAVTALGFWGNLEAESLPAQFGFTMSILHSRLGNGQSQEIGASYVTSGSYLESTLAEKRGRGLATITSLLRARPDLSLAESYSCRRNKNNSFGIILLQKKVGRPLPEVIH
jgi:hypothetical protein